MAEITVSVIVVFRNEERFLERCLNSVINQFDDSLLWELILVDGMSDDQSVQIVKKKLNSLTVPFKIISNPKKTLATGWNLGILNSSGQYIIRPDAHATLNPNYIKKALQNLENNPDIAVVGGLLGTEADNFTGKLIRSALSMKTGMGNSSFRTGEKSGFKDTAVYGLYRKSVFNKMGLLNERLARHQDTEFHFRMIKSGYKIYMSNEISATYYCRDSIMSLAKQMYDIGFNFSSLIKEGVGSAMRLRHWIPLIFYMGLMFLLAIGFFYIPMIKILILGLLVYLSVIFLESLLKCFNDKSLYPLAAIFIVPLIHFSYAAGTFVGLINLLYGRVKVI